MSKTVEIKCDGCGHDLTRSTNYVDYRLALVSELISNPCGVGTLMMKYPAIDAAAYFCGLQCLRKWIDHNETDGKRTESKE